MKKTLQKNSFLYFLLCNLLLFGLVGCDNDKDDDGVRNDKDKCNCINQEGVDVDANGCAIIDSISNIRIYIDASASMQGYFNKNADGKIIIDKINTALKVDTLFKSPEIYILGDSIKRFYGSAEDLANYMVKQKFANNKSSKLHNYLAQILDKQQASDISLFFTDNILSYSGPEINASVNREINKNNIEILSSRVKEVFSIAKNKMPICASIYGFQSDFFGWFYNYKNTPIDFNNGIERPFYCWVIANKKNIQKFEQKIDALYTTPIPHVNFGTTFEVVDKCFISPSIEQDGSPGFVVEENYTKISDIDMNELPIRIPIALNLSSLPTYAQTQDYLFSHLKLEPSQGLMAKIIAVKSSKEIDISQIKSPNTQEKFKENTHVILVDISGIDTKNATLKLTMPVMYDWYEQWNTMDDTNTDSLKNKTFGLSYLIGGLRETYEMKNTNYIHLNFILNR